MGGVLSAAPVGEAAVAHIRAGGDLCLICHHEDYITQAYETLVHTVESNPKFAKQVAESVRRVLTFKKKSAKILRITKPPSEPTVEKLSRKLWEFGEQVRLEALARAETDRNKIIDIKCAAPATMTVSMKKERHDRRRSDEWNLRRRHKCGRAVHAPARLTPRL